MELTDTDITRRGFVAATGAAIAAAAVQAPAACAEEAQGFDEQWDVIIVGGGLAGLSAAITVANEGNGESCLVIEKGEGQAGGCSPVCEGWWLGANDGVEYPAQYLKAAATTPLGQSVPDDALEAFAAGITENTAWVFSLAPDLTEDMFDRFDGTFDESRNKAEWREFDNAPTARTHLSSSNPYPYHHIFFMLDDYVENKLADRVTRRFGTALEELITDDGGAVVGVVANGVRLGAAKAVIMCCGGFENNPEWMEGYCGVGASVTRCRGCNTGDGHKAVMKVGADMWHMHGACAFALAPRDLANERWATQLWYDSQKAWGITVGVNGRRFYMDCDGNDFGSDAENDSWSEGELSLHVGSRHGLMQFGGEWQQLPMPAVGWFVFDQVGYENGAFDFDYTGASDPVGEGWLYRADTVEELAGLIGVPADQLAKTVQTWNGFCEGGEDLAFFRPASTLHEVAQPPFYAQRCCPQHVNTNGGPVRNGKAQVIDTKGEPIPGLYAAGGFGSVWGYRYQGCGGVGEAMAFGRIAARSVVAL